MKKLLLYTAGILAVMVGIIAIRLWLADRSAGESRKRFDAACAGDTTCLAAARDHFAACHEDNYDYQTYTPEKGLEPHRGAPENITPAALDWHAVILCVDERAPEWERPERFGLD